MSNENIDIITLANRVANEKENIRQAIENRGVNIPETTPLNQYPAKIMSIDTENVATDVYFAGDQEVTSNMLIAGNYGTIAPNAISNNSTITSIDLNYVATVGNHAFENDANLASFSGDHIKYVGDNAFANTGMTAVNNSHIEYIGGGAFSNCSSLTSVTTNAKLASNAFNNDSNLASFTATTDVIPSGCCADCGNLTNISVPNATAVGPFSFYRAGAVAYSASSSNLLDVVLPEAEIIGDYAFADNYGLHSVSAPKAKYVGTGAFSGRYNSTNDSNRVWQLASLNLPEVETIASGAFWGYISQGLSTSYYYNCMLTELNLPKCTNIGSYNFGSNGSYSCGSIQSLTVSNEGCSIGDYVFYGSSTPTPLKYYGKITEIGHSSLIIDSNRTSAASPLEFDFSNLRRAGNAVFSCYNSQLYVAGGSLDFASATQIGTSANYDGGIFSGGYNTGKVNCNVTKIWLPDTCSAFYTWIGGRSANDKIHVYTNATSGKSTWAFNGIRTTDTANYDPASTSSPYVAMHYNCTHEDFENGIYNV